MTDTGKVLEHNILEAVPDGINTYTVEKKNFEGYCFYKRSGQLSGKFTTAVKYVILTYKET